MAFLQCRPYPRYMSPHLTIYLLAGAVFVAMFYLPNLDELFESTRETVAQKKGPVPEKDQKLLDACLYAAVMGILLISVITWPVNLALAWQRSFDD